MKKTIIMTVMMVAMMTSVSYAQVVENNEIYGSEVIRQSERNAPQDRVDTKRNKKRIAKAQKKQIKQMKRVAKADGKVTRAERRVIKQEAKKMKRSRKEMKRRHHHHGDRTHRRADID